MGTPAHPWRSFLRDNEGVASIIGVFFIFLGLALSVMVLDVGHLYLTKRRLQAAVDSAALAAAGNPANAVAIVTRVLSDDGYAASPTVLTGAYTANPSVPVSQRLDTDPAAQQNAVRVTETVSTPSFIAPIIGGTHLSNVSATATAAQVPLVTFSAGTSLATANGGELNAVLGGLLGTNLSLSLVDYQALASTNVDALTFLNQLATQAGVNAGTYGDLANTNVSVGQMLAAATAALSIHPDGDDEAALTALNLLSLQIPSAVSATLGNVVSTVPWQDRQVGSIVQQTPGQTNFNLFDLFSAMARVYGAGQLAELGSTLMLPVSNTSVSTELSLGAQQAQAALAAVGTSISTSQTRILFTITAANINLGLVSANITLPLYLSIASGTATVAAIPCQTNGTMATIAAQPQAALAEIGTISNADLTNFGSDPDVQPATIVLLNILGIPVSITATGSLPVAAGSQTDENFTQSDIDAGTAQTAAGSDSGAIFTNLGNTMHLSASFNGGALTTTINSLLNNTVMPALQTELAMIMTQMDPAADTLLKTIGLRLGAMDVVVHGVRCGTPTLVG
jgi:uncharacterized membrane protein